MAIDLRKNTVSVYRTEEMVRKALGFTTDEIGLTFSNINTGCTGCTGANSGIGLTGGTGEGQCSSCKHFAIREVSPCQFGININYYCDNKNQNYFNGNIYYNYWCDLHESGMHESRLAKFKNGGSLK